MHERALWRTIDEEKDNYDVRSDFIRTTGTVEGVEVNISPTLSGRISKECCNEGDTVKEGDIVIAVLDRDWTRYLLRL